MSTTRSMRSGSIRRVREALVVGFRETVRAKALSCGIPPDSFRDWVEGMVGEGIAVALSCLDEWDQDRGDFLTWSRLKTRALIRDELARERRRHAFRDDRSIQDLKLPSNAPPVSRGIELQEQLLEIFDNLSEDQGKALMLYYLLGYSVKEISAITGRPDSTVYTLLSRGKKKGSEVISPPPV